MNPVNKKPKPSQAVLKRRAKELEPEFKAKRNLRINKRRLIQKLQALADKKKNLNAELQKTTEDLKALGVEAIIF